MSSCEPSCASHASSVTRSRQLLHFKIDGSQFLHYAAKGNSKRLGRGWTHFILDGFKSVWSTCAIITTDNYLTQSKKLKQGTVYWTGWGKCTQPGCINVRLTVNAKPNEGALTNVAAEITGVCTHIQVSDYLSRSNCRPLTGDLRTETGKRIVDCFSSPREEHLAAVSQMSPDECAGGNTTRCFNPAVLRQAAYEYRRNRNLHENWFYDLELYHRAWVAAMPGELICGYIQQIGLYPFNVSLFTRRTVETFVNATKHME